MSYAATGMPQFIQVLQDAGASKKNLEACVAGGALVGPVSQRDLNLDIGGLTAEVVETNLGQENIPVFRLEIR
jgi:chemotaxis receptor (MCP) glutamine deamidase CheD